MHIKSSSMIFRASALLIAMSVLLTGCTVAGRDEGLPDGTESSSGYMYDKDTAQISTSPRAAFSEKGCYYLFDDIMYFYDAAADSSLPVCSRSDCAHSTSTCDAYAHDNSEYSPNDMKGVSVNCLGNMIWYGDGKLYMIRREESGDYLMQYDSDFTNEVRLCTLADNGSMVSTPANVGSGSALLYNGYLYYTYVNFSDRDNADGMATVYCCRIRSEKGAVREALGSFDFAIDYMGICNRVCAGGDLVYFIHVGSNRLDKKNSDDDTQLRIYSYDNKSGDFAAVADLNSGEANDILGENTGEVDISGDGVCADDKGNVYLLSGTYGPKNDKGQQQIENLKIIRVSAGQDAQSIYQTASVTLISSLIWDGEYVYFYERDAERQRNGCIVRIDKNGAVKGRYDITANEQKHAEDVGEKLAKQYPANIDMNIYGIDGQNLFVYTSSEYIKGLECTDVTSKQYRRTRTRAVGMISKEAFDDPDIPIKSIYTYH